MNFSYPQCGTRESLGTLSADNAASRHSSVGLVGTAVGQVVADGRHRVPEFRAYFCG
jgi:hypothetical protein